MIEKLPPYAAWIKRGLEEAGHGAKGKLAKALKLHPSQITRLIEGERRIQPGEISKVAAVIGAPPPELLRGLLHGLVDEAAGLDPAPSAPTLAEFDIRAGTSYGGGMDGGEPWEEPIGGKGETITTHAPVAQWGLPPSYVEKELGLTYGFADILQIQGDSMDDGSRTALMSGDRVIIDRRSTDPRQGGIFAIWDGEGVIVKQVELIRGEGRKHIICKSLNRRYDPIHLDLAGDVHVIGRVAGRISRM